MSVIKVLQTHSILKSTRFTCTCIKPERVHHSSLLYVFKFAEIRSYIKTRSKLGLSVKYTLWYMCCLLGLRMSRFPPFSRRFTYLEKSKWSLNKVLLKVSVC